MAVIEDSSEASSTQYTLSQKLDFLDSVGRLTLRQLKHRMTRDEDSVFHSRKSPNTTLSAKEFEKFKVACKNGLIDKRTAQKLLPHFVPDSSEYNNGELIPISFYPFGADKYDFNEYAVCSGAAKEGGGGNVYFFKSNKLISQHNIYHRYGLKLKHYKDTDGRTVVYYKENFGSGSGIWQHNYYFYKYYGNKLVPVLNILENGNYTWPGPRIYWLKTFVSNESPLQLKFVYTASFRDSTITDVLNNSTTVTFRYNPERKRYEGDFERSTINGDKILTYYLGENELLFVHAYNKELRNWIEGSNKTKREKTQNYLNEVMNQVYAGK
jgi:hypothetical protein